MRDAETRLNAAAASRNGASRRAGAGRVKTLALLNILLDILLLAETRVFFAGVHIQKCFLNILRRGIFPCAIGE